jgi:hypothetical protein
MNRLTAAGTAAYSEVYKELYLPQNTQFVYRAPDIEYIEWKYDAAPPLNLPTEDAFRPRTELGRRLWEIRKRSIVSGARLLNWEEIEREIKDRRGGQDAEDL